MSNLRRVAGPVIQAMHTLHLHEGNIDFAIKSLEGSAPRAALLHHLMSVKAAVGAADQSKLPGVRSHAANDLTDQVIARTALGKLTAKPGAVITPDGYGLGDVISMNGADFHQPGSQIPVGTVNTGKRDLTGKTVSALVVTTNEVLRLAPAGTQAAIENALIAGVARVIDTAFFSDAAAGASPAGAFNGVTPITAPDGSFSQKLAALIQEHAKANALVNSVLMLPVSSVLNLTQEDITRAQILGLDIVTVQNMGDGIAAALISAAALSITLSGTAVRVFEQGSVRMTDDVTDQNSITPKGNKLVSLFQTNSVAFLATAVTDWKVIKSGVTLLAA